MEKTRFDQQTTYTAMLSAVIVLALLTVLVATDPDPGEAHPHAEENFSP